MLQEFQQKESHIMRGLYIPVSLSLIFTSLLAIVWAGGAAAADPGLKTFVESRCYTCHTINAMAAEVESEKTAFAKAKGVELKEGKNDDEDSKKGGDLSDIGKRREAKWLKDFVKNPKPGFKAESKCKRNAKKKYRKRFKGTDEEYDVLISFLSGLKHGSHKEAEFESCLK